MRTRLPLVLTLGTALLIGLSALGGQLTSLGDRFLGLEYVDHYGTQWFYWFVEHQTRALRGPGHTDLFFYPWGKDIWAHTGANVLDAYLALPLRMTLGRVLGYNVFVLWGIVATGLAFSALAREFTDDGVAIGVSSTLFATGPFILFELAEGRPTQAILVLPVLFCLMLWRSGTRRGWSAPVAAGVLLALCGYQYWYYAFFGGMAALAHGAWRFVAPASSSDGRWRTLARHAVIAAVSLALTAPVAYSLVIGHTDDGDIPGLIDTDAWTLRQSPPVTREDTTVGMFLWQPLKRHTGAYVQEVDGTERFLVRASWVPLVLWLSALAWLWRPGRLERGPMLAVVLVSTALATGPFVLLGDTALPNPVYIALVKHLPFLQRLWWPARAFAFAFVFLGLTMAVNLARLRELGLRFQVPAAVLAALIWTAELAGLGLIPYPTWDATIPAGYRCLASGPPGALIELPYAWTQAHLYYQVEHGRPIMGGMIENNMVFTPPESATFRDENTYVASLIAAAMQEGEGLEWTEEDKGACRDLGYAYIVVQKDAFYVAGDDQALVDNVRRTRLRHMRKTLTGMAGHPIYEDARVMIYSPFGLPLPCDPDLVGLDTVRVGRSDIGAEMLFTRRPEDQIFTRWLPPLDPGGGSSSGGDDDSARGGGGDGPPP